MKLLSFHEMKQPSIVTILARTWPTIYPVILYNKCKRIAAVSSRTDGGRHAVTTRQTGY